MRTPLAKAYMEFSLAAKFGTTVEIERAEERFVDELRLKLLEAQARAKAEAEAKP